MERLKKFLLYAVLVAALWIFSDLVIYVSLNGMYRSISSKVYTNNPEIVISQNKATSINGHIDGYVLNNTESIITNQYIKIDFYTARDVKAGTKYILIENLELKEKLEFEMWHKYSNVDYATVTITDNIEDNSEKNLLSEREAQYIVLAALIMLYFS